MEHVPMRDKVEEQEEEELVAVAMVPDQAVAAE